MDEAHWRAASFFAPPPAPEHTFPFCPMRAKRLRCAVTHLQLHLRGILRVDADILRAQIAGPEAAGAAAITDADADRIFRLLKISVRRLLVLFRRGAPLSRAF